MVLAVRYDKRKEHTVNEVRFIKRNHFPLENNIRTNTLMKTLGTRLDRQLYMDVQRNKSSSNLRNKPTEDVGKISHHSK